MTTPPPIEPTEPGYPDSAGDGVRAELRNLPPLTMPADVANRLHEAFAAETAQPPPAPKKPRNRREFALAGAASLVIVAIAVGVIVNMFSGNDQTKDNATKRDTAATSEQNKDSSNNEKAPSAEEGLANADTQQREDMVLASGTDYRRNTMLQQVVAAAETPEIPADQVASRIPELATLAQVDRLQACTDELSATGRIGGLDFAHFEGKPALIVLVQISATAESQEDRKVVLVVGPNCTTGNPDHLYSTQLN